MMTKAHSAAMTPDAIIRAFKDSGIYPLDRSLLLQQGKLAPSAYSSRTDPVPVMPPCSRKHAHFIEYITDLMNEKYNRVFHLPAKEAMHFIAGWISPFS